MTLRQAIRKFGTEGMDLELLELTGQRRAYDRCMRFLSRVRKTRKVGRKAPHTYELKHVLERSFGQYLGYVYEGTVVLAAKASGFTVTGRSAFGGRLNINLRDYVALRKARKSENQSE